MCPWYYILLLIQLTIKHVLILKLGDEAKFCSVVVLNFNWNNFKKSVKLRNVFNNRKEYRIGTFYQ